MYSSDGVFYPRSQPAAVFQRLGDGLDLSIGSVPLDFGSDGNGGFLILTITLDGLLNSGIEC